jgi:hypothetical protein
MNQSDSKAATIAAVFPVYRRTVGEGRVFFDANPRMATRACPTA